MLLVVEEYSSNTQLQFTSSVYNIKTILACGVFANIGLYVLLPCKQADTQYSFDIIYLRLLPNNIT